MLALLVLAACSGGSGGSREATDGPGPVPTPPQPPPAAGPAPADQRLVLTADAARGAFARAFALTDVAVSLSTVAL